MTMRRPCGSLTTLRCFIFTVPSKLDSKEDWSTTLADATPPRWKVRMVSCVPGSPIDCAAMTPTASPRLTGGPEAGGRILDVLGGGAAEHALPERHRPLARLKNGARRDAFARAAILLGHDAVLRHVDETPREIARVGRLERRVGQTLAGAVGRVEVLEHRQPLLEVGDDRRLDDLARRLGHQTAHAGQLLHLGGRAARARMRHHIDGVDRLFPAGVW